MLQSPWRSKSRSGRSAVRQRMQPAISLDPVAGGSGADDQLRHAPWATPPPPPATATATRDRVRRSDAIAR